MSHYSSEGPLPEPAPGVHNLPQFSRNSLGFPGIHQGKQQVNVCAWDRPLQGLQTPARIPGSRLSRFCSHDPCALQVREGALSPGWAISSRGFSSTLQPSSPALQSLLKMGIFLGNVNGQLSPEGQLKIPPPQAEQGRASPKPEQ